MFHNVSCDAILYAHMHHTACTCYTLACTCYTPACTCYTPACTCYTPACTCYTPACTCYTPACTCYLPPCTYYTLRMYRIMDINRALFVNFAVRTFLESSGQPRLSQLKDFSQKMESLFLADEKCSLMNHQLNRFKTAIEEDSMTWGEHWQDREKVFSCLGDYLFTYVYQNIFYPNGSTDKEIDK